MSKLLSVFGATGQQGGALINYILKTPELSKIFRLRGLTRDISKPKAVELKQNGVEMVQADLNDPPTLIKALEGSDVVFGVTNFWEQASAEVEIAQGKAIADASIAVGATQLIWSSLPNISNLSHGTVIAKHFDSKAVVEDYIRTLNIKSLFYMPGAFMQNYVTLFRPQPAGDGTYTFTPLGSPTSAFPLIDILDTGKFLTPALLNPELYHGKNFTCATAYYTASEMVEIWSKVTGKVFKLVESDFAHFPEKFREGMKEAEGFGKFGYFGPEGRKDLEWTLKQVSGKLSTFEDFVRANGPWCEV